MTDEKQKDLQLNIAGNTEVKNATSRLEQRKLRQTPEQKKVEKDIEGKSELKKQSWVQIRLLPIWLRVVLVLLLLAATVTLGLTIGYGTIGDGNSADVLKKETWTHIIDIISGKES
ncbi:DNA-directed RNA polymerase subunit beta [Filibacter tadaridae]|uniref:DNA-directed RNA polymerase subunit beta n=1 Tax=Filibacter tadaridae TaxID=2483811 RepID=A0A3P5WIE1_9BACL|nr:DNA-directed RNA polymerase subunit beta [Filibacter tadaridae]VDC19440.1 DNA-directed RNA polymerase subunit beta [Filibacter tadaridae]